MSREPAQPVKKKPKTASYVKAKQRSPNWSNYTEKPLHQSVLSIDNSKGLSFRVDPNQRKVVLPPPMNLDASISNLT